MRGTNERKGACKSSRNVAPVAARAGSPRPRAPLIGDGARTQKNRQADATLADSVTRPQPATAKDEVSARAADDGPRSVRRPGSGLGAGGPGRKWGFSCPGGFPPGPVSPAGSTPTPTPPTMAGCRRTTDRSDRRGAGSTRAGRSALAASPDRRPTRPRPGGPEFERLQSFAAPRPAPLVSSAHGASGSSSSGASGATPPDPAIAAIIASQEQNGSLSYNAVLTILDDAAAGGMTAAKFAALEGFALSSTRPAASASRLT